jgi:DNA-directed RNA polymerase subunit RPC12/RpoP
LKSGSGDSWRQAIPDILTFIDHRYFFRRRDAAHRRIFSVSEEWLSSVELRTPQFQFHFVSVCNRSGSIRNAMAEKISAGSVCPDCGKGTMEPEKGVPIRGRPGFSQVVYRCTECGKVLRQAEDDRFRS